MSQERSKQQSECPGSPKCSAIHLLNNFLSEPQCHGWGCPPTLPCSWAAVRRQQFVLLESLSPLSPGLARLLSSRPTQVKLSVNSKTAFSPMALQAVPFPIFLWQSLFTGSPETWLGRQEPWSHSIGHGPSRSVLGVHNHRSQRVPLGMPQLRARYTCRRAAFPKWMELSPFHERPEC